MPTIGRGHGATPGCRCFRQPPQLISPAVKVHLDEISAVASAELKHNRRAFLAFDLVAHVVEVPPENARAVHHAQHVMHHNLARLLSRMAGHEFRDPELFEALPGARAPSLHRPVLLLTHPLPTRSSTAVTMYPSKWQGRS